MSNQLLQKKNSQKNEPTNHSSSLRLPSPPSEPCPMHRPFSKFCLILLLAAIFPVFSVWADEGSPPVDPAKEAVAQPASEEAAAGESDDGTKIDAVEKDATEQGAAEKDDEKPEEMQTLTLHEGRLRFRLPAAWKRVKPRNRLIEMELAVLPQRKKDDPEPDPKQTPGRMTLMSSGGSPETILRRWAGRFRLGQDADGKDTMHRDVIEMDQAVVHTLDISGAYFDEPKGPLRPKVEMPNTRMLGAIIEVEQAGRFFVKIYGPEPLVTEQAEAFWKMLAELEVLEAPDEEEEAAEEPKKEDKPATESDDAEGTTEPSGDGS